jgi:TetR/AcrR family transcriptional regulator, transcriptional repressor for nem operon
MDTRTTLLAAAEDLIRSRGFNGFSYADLAERVGIRKASIHHYFPAKEDLGRCLIEHYIERFTLAFADIDANESSVAGKLERYVELYRQSLRQQSGCLCGMLATEIDVVPASMAEGVRRFMQQNLDWLTQTIAVAREQGDLAASTDARGLALALLSICQGTLLVARSTNDPAGFDRSIESLLQAVLPAPAQLPATSPQRTVTKRKKSHARQ